MLLLAQLVVFGMVTFQAYCVGNVFGFHKGSNQFLRQMKKVYEGCN